MCFHIVFHVDVLLRCVSPLTQLVVYPPASVGGGMKLMEMRNSPLWPFLFMVRCTPYPWGCVRTRLSVSLSLCLSVSLSLCLSVSLSLCVSVPRCLCASVSVSLCLCVSVSLCLCASVPLCLCLSVPLCLCVSVSLCLCVSVVSVCVHVASSLSFVVFVTFLLAAVVRRRGWTPPLASPR